MLRDARFDSTTQYRYWLARAWSDAPRIGFVMLNPATADATRDDPTLRLCMGFARQWGYGGLEVVNLFAFRTSYPRELRQISDPVGERNDAAILETAARVDALVVAWGNHGSFQGRDQHVLRLLGDRVPLLTFGRTKSGQPRHPLHLGYITPVTPYRIP